MTKNYAATKYDLHSRIVIFLLEENNFIDGMKQQRKEKTLKGEERLQNTFRVWKETIMAVVTSFIYH